MRRYALLLLPLGAGLGLAALWRAGVRPNVILYLRADVATLFLLLGLTGGVVGAVGLVVWNQGRARRELAVATSRQEQADSHRRFIRRLDHELKNPLTAIRAGLANLADQPDSATLSSVRTQVDRLARLTTDLRKLADLETRPIEMEPVDLGLLLSDLLEEMQERPEAATCHVGLSLPHVPWPLPSVAGDRDLLFLALHNLVDNALKFACANDTIEIRAFEDSLSVVVEVADTGPGVEEADLAHLGEELYRGSAARAVEGSGLGLALVRSIVARHNGNFAIRSRSGQGTVVTLRLPTAH
jgi:two-component system OmpR family sensor kinase